MTVRIRLHRDVPGDLQSILQFLSAQSPETANRFRDGVQITLTDLAAMPGKGSLKNFRNSKLSGIRSWFVTGFPNHLILYRPIENGIRVLAIVHGARFIQDVLQDRE